MRKKIWIGVITGVIAIGGYIVYSAYVPRSVEGTPVSLATVVQKDMESRIMTTGKVKMEQEMTVYAGASGKIVALHAAEGAPVKKGQILGEIYTEDIKNQLIDIDSQLIDMDEQARDVDNQVADTSAQIAEKKAELAKLQAANDAIEIAKAENGIRQAEQELEQAKREYARIKTLVESGAEKKQELDKASDQIKQAEFKLKTSQYELAEKKKGPKREEVTALLVSIAQLEERKKRTATKKESIASKKQKIEEKRQQLLAQRNDALIVAPIDGTVLTQKAKAGEYTTKGNELLKVGTTQNIYVEAEIAEADIGKVRVGQKAKLEGGALGKQVAEAHVVSISPVAIEAATQKSGQQSERAKVAVKLALDKPNELLRPGFRIDVTIVHQSAKQALQVPIEAVQKNGGKAFVWINENGLAKKKAVVTGMENELFAEVKQGLKAGTKVITNPGPQLKENEPVMEANVPGEAR
ncbi:efflux RND transporter periplasmic adaptor subunit [Aneurinibacillus thermoaerophilus]|uniref:efflux RND transporter periplasmic adaptor subunit n=1 Tax=Aneurinibacillus thermoaerophilus TaxID=143495 RepID=UPI002E1F742D|nr:efflux RND transporter periplasmic adaptor subunit [Aneurinibacillus thermoaerophilus]MED0678826.1 efflux RND transporter periplasmic adaptor subunit [Aneurinibacillus thermoaerophilus]MED0736699.1 efflux RND transporter periplasmic adaptor subunit [Aneurinibacillus thermoaerophilus]MED0765230.1 efflux RND transporter periplasmic adaptor subunit [Aneurinibacillus thermoaerophilus]